MMRKCIAWYLVIAMFIIGVAPSVQASFSPSESPALSGFDRTSDLQKIRAALEMKLVQQRLSDLGFSADEINARISQLDDQQVHNFAQQLDQLRVGGFWGWVLAIAVVIVVILFVLPLFGVRLLT